MRLWLMAALVALTLPASAAEIRVMAAGSLKDPFTAIFADFSRQYGVGFSSVWGPSGLLRERLQGGEGFDVFASAALPHAQALTDAGVSGPSVMFARVRPRRRGAMASIRHALASGPIWIAGSSPLPVFSCVAFPRHGAGRWPTEDVETSHIPESIMGKGGPSSQESGCPVIVPKPAPGQARPESLVSSRSRR